MSDPKDIKDYDEKGEPSQSGFMSDNDPEEEVVEETEEEPIQYTSDGRDE